MWDWLKQLRRSRRRENRTTTFSDSDQADEASSTTFPDPSRQNPFLSGFYRQARETSHPFFISSGPLSVEPKCLSRIPCSQILQGARIENFSNRCWLENNLHMFGSPNANVSSILNHVENHSSSSSESDSVSECFDFLDDEYDLETLSGGEDLSSDSNHSDFSQTEEHILTHAESHTDISLRFNLDEIINPPPYTEFEPPPTYEEAVGCVDRRSTSSRSTSSSLAFMW